ncbi:MAG: N-acetyltransferase family protein [Halodesulfurarchaeum sp.]
MRIRQARTGDREAVVSFTEDTWPDRFGGDYIPDVFDTWIETDGDTQRTLVAVDDEPIGIVQVVLLSEYEAWLQGIRVDPDARDRGVGRALSHTAFDWAADRGATVARNMVFSWNVKGLGLSRAVGFEPGIEFRWAHPDPDESAGSGAAVSTDVNAAWSFWQRSTERDDLDGLGLHMGESWAVSELTRDRLRRAAEEESLLVLGDSGTDAVTYRTRVYEREREGEPRTWAEYGAAAWEDEAACEALMAEIARDAGAAGAEFVRVLIPETPRAVTDVASHRIEVAEDPDFVLAADLTAPYRES